jgi:uncharacterized membrane protein
MEEPRGGYTTPSYQSTLDADRLRSLRTLTHVLYALYAVHWLTGGLTGLIAVIINYVKRSGAAGTAYEAHFDWQIRTFWYGLIGYLIGFALIAVLIGLAVLWVVGIWMLYRIIKGWLYLYDNKPLLSPRGWF